MWINIFPCLEVFLNGIMSCERIGIELESKFNWMFTCLWTLKWFKTSLKRPRKFYKFPVQSS